MKVFGALIRCMRPRQWIKNILVVTAPVAAGAIFEPHVLLMTGLAFAVFCMAASGIYLVNDAKDVEADRAHPTKCKRPIAAGQLPVPVAWTAAVVLLLGAPALSLVANWQLALAMVVYEVVQLAYCFGMKHEPVLELVSVASGFLLRAIAGGLAADVPLSKWFLATAGFGSLFMAAGKRYAEARLVERTGARIRRVLDHYTPTYLRFVWTLSAGVMLTTYSLWAFEIQENSKRYNTAAILSAIPFLIGVLRYAVDVDRGDAGEPEDIVLKDKTLIGAGLAWAALMAASVYGAKVLT